jgi:hypothetical protein
VTDLDRVLFQTLPRVLRSGSTIENQLLGIDLATKRPMRYQVALSVSVTWKNGTFIVPMNWERRGQRPVYLTDPKISNPAEEKSSLC